MTLTADTDRLPDVSPYNTFQLTCSGQRVESLSFQVIWCREIGPGNVETVTASDSDTEIETLDTEPLSVLTATRTETGQYVFYCEVVYFYDEEYVGSATSISVGVTIVGKNCTLVCTILC